MNTFHLPDQTHIGHAHLRVTNLERSLAFYRDLLGLNVISQQEKTAVLSSNGDEPRHLVLTEQANARPKPSRSTGLYHVAIRLPDRVALGRVFARLIANQWPLQGYSDHRVSEALYLPDPDGNGLELYRDRPREDWPWVNHQVDMATTPLDIESLLRDAQTDSSPWQGIHPATDIGHVHLHVSDLARAEAFYSGVLGFDVVQRTYPGALFVSAGGYHHHVGLNVWAGKNPPPDDAVGLIAFSVNLPDKTALDDVLARAEKAGVRVEDERDYGYATGVLVRDQDGNGVELLAEQVTIPS
jgi:catechol 2,3-dioxygenase